jgi:hypothetical protein
MNKLQPEEETSTMEEMGRRTLMKTDQTPNCLYPVAAADDDDDDNYDGHG